LFTAASSSFSNPIFRSGEDCRHFNFNNYSGIALLEFLSQLPRCLVGQEACSSAHYWAREIERLGHRV